MMMMMMMMMIAIICDNSRVNQKFFKLSVSVTDKPWLILDGVYLLFDFVHLLKSIRNNWITEKTHTLEFIDMESGEICFAKWKDLVELYKSELESDLKMTKLDYKSLHHNNFEKQKFNLACNIFNEKTCVALAGKEGKEVTFKFINYVTKIWNILNIRSTDIAYRLNDSNREKVTDPCDPRVEFF